MPEQYIITGTINPTDSAERAGIRVQAFDRDLPSLERRTGSAPQRLGEAVTDAEGRFQITYTLEQFQGGEAISRTPSLQAQSADLSFRVFDRAGQELNIKSIEALNREYPAGQIIFNAPTPLEVNINVDVPQEISGASEYEQLMARLAPAIADLTLVDLLDEDVAFLSSELGLEQQPEVQPRIDWLQRSAMLAQETNLPVEAFYGWGRKDIPAALTELAAIAMQDLSAVLEKLISLAGEELSNGLLAAVEENIIPARFRERADAIANALRRHAQQETAVRLRLERDPTGEALVGYMVTTYDIEANNRDLGTDVTDALGEFVVAYSIEAGAPETDHNLHFRVRGPNITQAIELTERIKTDTSAAGSLRIPLPAAEATLQQIRDAGHVDVPDDTLVVLEKKYGIRSLTDIRRMGGLSRIKEQNSLDSTVTRRLDALADLERLSSDLNEASVLLDHQYESVFSIAEASRNEFIAAMTAPTANFSERRAIELHIAAKAQTDILDQIFAGIAIDFANGIRPPADFEPGDYFPPFPQEQQHG